MRELRIKDILRSEPRTAKDVRVMWIGALVGLFVIGAALVLRDYLRTKRQRKCPCCGARELIRKPRARWRHGVSGIHWTCARCHEPLFEPWSTSFPKDYPGPMTAEQHDAYIEGFQFPAARSVTRHASRPVD